MEWDEGFAAGRTESWRRPRISRTAGATREASGLWRESSWGAAMTVAWDIVVRGWLVVTTWLALRRKPSLARLVKTRAPRRFVRAAMIAAGRPTGGQIAIAVAMLPRRRRAEATAAF